MQALASWEMAALSLEIPSSQCSGASTACIVPYGEILQFHAVLEVRRYFSLYLWESPNLEIGLLESASAKSLDQF